MPRDRRRFFKRAALAYAGLIPLALVVVLLLSYWPSFAVAMVYALATYPYVFAEGE